MPGELGMSPLVSEEMVDDGEAGGLSSMCDEPGVLWWSAVAAPLPPPVRRRLDGGMMDDEADGECGRLLPWVGPGLEPSWSDTSPETTEDRGEPGDAGIGVTGWVLGESW